MKIPHLRSPVSAGFPSPADDFVDTKLDLNEHLIRHPSATFFVTVSGDSMQGAGILSKDLCIVDKSLEPWDGAIVIAALGGELTIKRLRITSSGPELHPENSKYPIIKPGESEEFLVWGVVTSVIHQFVFKT